MSRSARYTLSCNFCTSAWVTRPVCAGDDDANASTRAAAGATRVTRLETRLMKGLLSSGTCKRQAKPNRRTDGNERNELVTPWHQALDLRDAREVVVDHRDHQHHQHHE